MQNLVQFASITKYIKSHFSIIDNKFINCVKYFRYILLAFIKKYITYFLCSAKLIWKINNIY